MFDIVSKEKSRQLGTLMDDMAKKTKFETPVFAEMGVSIANNYKMKEK